MPRGSHLQDEQQERIAKSLILAIGAFCLLLVLFVRLIFVQIIEADVNIELSKENRMQLKILKAPRGLILDRNGNGLARNRPSYSVCVLPYKMKKTRKETLQKLLLIRDRDERPLFDSTELTELVKKASYRRFDETRIKEDVAMDIVSVVEEHSMDLPGVSVEIESRREYPLGSKAFHVLGYMSEIPEEQFDSLKSRGYRYGDLMGKAGLEKQYEDLFRGKDGQEYVEVNAYGKQLGVISDLPRVDPVPGDEVYLTIDADLQKMAADSFPDTMKGAVIMLDPRNGDVLALYSSPSVDPNIFSASPSERSTAWAEVATDPSLPLNNRVTCGTYAPGSTFKLVSATTGLATGAVVPTSTMPASCNGSFHYGGRIAHCWKPEGHGRLNLIDAVKNSCNVYFYQLGLRVGDRALAKYARMFGLGQVTGIDLPVEREGWLSGEEAYNKRFAYRGWKWTGGLVLDMAIGQAQVLTPIQLALMVGGVADGKRIYRPRLVKEIRSSEGIVVKQNAPRILSTLDLRDDVVAAMHEALKAVIEPGGTGGRAAVPGIPVGGKTGSAQNPQGELTHALFVACAPVDSPVVAVAVVVENAGHGGSIAGPIVGALLRHFFAATEEGQRLVKYYAAKAPQMAKK